MDPLLKDLSEKQQSFRRNVVSLASELKEVRDRLASQEQSFARETLTRQEAEIRAKNMEEEIWRLQNNLEERNGQLQASASAAEKEAIEDITMRMGAGMAKFICKEVETIDDYDEYCHYVGGLVGLRLSKLFHASGSEDLASDSLSKSMGLFLQKTNIIQDYLEDINEIPKSRMFWPRQIWSKYVNKLEDLKYKENSAKAVECLNDMVTNALIHVEDCLTSMSALRDPSIF